MKDTTRLLLVLLVFGSMMLTTACAAPPPDSPEPGDEEAVPAEEVAAPAEEVAAPEPDCKVGIVVLVLSGSSFQVTLADTAKQEAEALGCEAFVAAPDSFGDYEGQISIVEDMIAKQVDLILLVASHPQALVPAVDKAWEAGIPVVNVDNRVESDKVITYIGTDNVEGSYVAGQYIAEQLGGEGTLLLLLGEVGTPNEAYRTEGFLRAMEEYPDIEIVAQQNAHWTEAGALEVTENVLQAHPDIDAIYGENDASAIGAAQACKNAGVDPLIVGFDGTPEAIDAIKDDLIDATIAQFPTRMAQISLRVGLSYLDYLQEVDGLVSTPLISPVIDTGVEVIDASNVESFEGIWVSEMSE